MFAVLSMAGDLSPEIAAQMAELGPARPPARPIVIDLGPEPARDFPARDIPGGNYRGRCFSACLRLLLDDAETEGVVLVLDENTPFAEAELALLAAEGRRKPVVVHFARAQGGWAERAAVSGNVVNFARGRRHRTLRALSAAGIAVAASPAQIGVEMKRAQERRSGIWPRDAAMLDFASAIRWVDRNVY